MRINKETVVEGQHVLLVSYKKEHVPKYHEWMKSPELQHYTASEPLTLIEEYQMQKAWLDDLDKCTFIILEKSIFEGTGDEVAAMIGDTNLFFTDMDNPHSAEAEIMIAELSARGKHRGKEAMLLMFMYGIEVLGVDTFKVKIGLDNEKSMKMFVNLGFREVSRSDVFKEVTLIRSVNEQWKKWLHREITHYKIVNLR